MKVEVKNLEGKAEEQADLPEVFEEGVRPDIIKRAVISAQSSRIQSKGSSPRAGMDTTAETPSKGSGQTRVRRVKGRGYHAAGRSAWAPFTVGGRQAHPPKSEEDRSEKVNKKEKRLAIRSAISATKEPNLVSSRGHVVDGIEGFPLVLEDDFEGLKKTREVQEVLEGLEVWSDVERVKDSRTIRAGKGKSRGRPYKKGVGPLLVVGEDKGIFRAARNIPGVDLVTVDQLNAELLAPGGSPGRLTIWTESALEKVNRRVSD